MHTRKSAHVNTELLDFVMHNHVHTGGWKERVLRLCSHVRQCDALRAGLKLCLDNHVAHLHVAVIVDANVARECLSEEDVAVQCFNQASQWAKLIHTQSKLEANAFTQSSVAASEMSSTRAALAGQAD